MSSFKSGSRIGQWTNAAQTDCLEHTSASVLGAYDAGMPEVSKLLVKYWPTPRNFWCHIRLLSGSGTETSFLRVLSDVDPAPCCLVVSRRRFASRARSARYTTIAAKYKKTWPTTLSPQRVLLAPHSHLYLVRRPTTSLVASFLPSGTLHFLRTPTMARFATLLFALVVVGATSAAPAEKRSTIREGRVRTIFLT